MSFLISFLEYVSRLIKPIRYYIIALNVCIWLILIFNNNLSNLQSFSLSFIMFMSFGLIFIHYDYRVNENGESKFRNLQIANQIFRSVFMLIWLFIIVASHMFAILASLVERNA